MGLALALQLLLAAGEEGRGQYGVPPSVVLEQRPASRLRATLGVGAALQLARVASAGGLALVGDLGVVLGDRLSLGLHGSIGSLVLTAHGSLGAAADYFVSEHLALGLGVAFTGWVNGFAGAYGNFFGITVPLRLAWFPGERRPTEVERRGLVVAFELAPGLDLQARTFGIVTVSPEFGTALLLSIGYTLR